MERAEHHGVQFLLGGLSQMMCVASQAYRGELAGRNSWAFGSTGRQTRQVSVPNASTRHARFSCAFGSRTVDSSSGPLVEKHVKRYDPAVPHDDEIPPGVSRHFTRASRYPWNHPCIAIFLRSGSHLISKVRMSRLDHARDAIDLVAATNSALAGIVEHAIFGPEFVDGRTPTRGIV